MNNVVKKVINLENVVALATSMLMTLIIMAVVFVIGIPDFNNVWLASWLISVSPKMLVIDFILVRLFYAYLDVQ